MKIMKIMKELKFIGLLFVGIILNAISLSIYQQYHDIGADYWTFEYLGTLILVYATMGVYWGVVFNESND